MSWGIPFKSFENLEEAIGASKSVPQLGKVSDAAAKASWETIEKRLERTETWRNFPQDVKDLIAAGAQELLKLGYSSTDVGKQVDDLIEAVNEDVTALFNHPLLRVRRAYADILKKTPYPSLDLKIVARMRTGPNTDGFGKTTTLELIVTSDDFPTYAVMVARRPNASGELAAVSWSEAKLPGDPRFSASKPWLMVDPTVLSAGEGRVVLLKEENVQGTTLAKLALLSAMNVLVHPVGDNPFGSLLPRTVGGTERTIRWDWLSSAS